MTDKSKDAPEPSDAPHAGERIAKVMARAGLASRREAEAWIAAGRVSVNGQTITSAALNIEPTDKVAVDGKPLPARERTRLWLYHKPRGLVTTAKDPEGRTTVFEVLPPELPRVVSVGRLDLNTEGLLLLTNDGGLARVLAHPSTAWLRRYRVRVFGQVDLTALEALKGGIEIEGFSYGPIEAVLDRQQGDNAWLTLGLREGKNREVRRVLEHLGLSVNRLIRISFGPFQLGDLGEGAVEEIRTRYLKDQLGSLADEAECDFEAPVVDRTPAPVTQALRVRAEKADAPRRRAGLTTDRKGRRVLIERVGEKPEPKPRKPKPRDDRSDARPPRRDGPAKSGRTGRPAPRTERAGKPFRSGEGRTPRDENRRPPGDRPRPPRRDGDAPRPFKPREARGERQERPQEPRPNGNRARVFHARPPREERPERDDRRGPPRERSGPPRGDRPDREARPPRRDGEAPRSFEKRPGGRPPSRSGGPRPAGAGGKPGGRPSGDRPSGGRPSGDRPGGKPAGRPGGGKPGGRPFGKPGGRPSGGKPGGRPGGGKPGGGKPGGRPRG